MINRDEEAAWRYADMHSPNAENDAEAISTARVRQVIQKHFIAGLAHCRETEVKPALQANNLTSKMLADYELMEKQLRVAVEALRKAKSRYWERCYDGSGNTRALTLNEFDAEVDCALQKIEAMKGGGDAKT